jgi:predicted PurR-regulated permease PerM
MAVRAAHRESRAEERVSQGGMHLAALAVLTLVALYFGYRIVEPFLPALAWAVALAIISYPAHDWIRRRIRHDAWAAIVSTALVVLIILVPSLFATGEIMREARTAGNVLREQAENGKLRDAAIRMPYGEQLIPWLEGNLDVKQATSGLVGLITRDASELLKGSLWAALQALVTIFVLYFCFRDRDRLLRGLRGLILLPPAETEAAFRRVDDSIHATVYGTIVTGLIQGTTGGLLFWALGLPAPVLWGTVMFVLSVLPIVGAFIVWVPAAVLLLSQDRYWSALALVVWGLLMAGPVGNYLYAYLAGDRMRMHPVPALLAFIGGLAVFGITGMILGPVILVLTFELIQVWRRRAIPDTDADESAGPIAALELRASSPAAHSRR